MRKEKKMNMKKKWAKAQTLEPIHWLDNREKIGGTEYQNEVRKRSNHIFENIKKRLDTGLENIKILEIGGGATPLAIYVKNCEITLADPLMDFYTETFPSVFPENCKSYQCKAEDLPFKDDHFDVVVTRNTLDHVEDVNLCIQEIRRVLKKNGVAYIGMNVFAGPLLFYKTINKDPEHPYTFSKRSFVKLIKRSFTIKYSIDDDPINGNHFEENEDQTWYKKFFRRIFLKLGNYKIVELYTLNEK